jgi:hypothetical protein
MMENYATYYEILQPLIQSALRSPGLLAPNEFNLARYSLNQHTRNRLLDPDICALEDYLIDHSALPGKESNLELLRAFGDVIYTICHHEEIPLQDSYKNMEWLLAWLNMHHPPAFFGEDPDSPLQMLQMAAAVGLGVWAGVFSQIQSGTGTLLELANSPLWRVRDTAAMGLHRMLSLSWETTLRRLRFHAMQANSLEWGAIISSISYPPLLEGQPFRVLDVLDLQQQALRFVSQSQEAHPLLREALSRCINVAVEALPSVGLAQLRAWAAWPHVGVKEIIRDSLAGLAHWSDEVDRIAQQL